MTKKSTASETKRKGSKSALKSGQGIEDQVMDILDKGVKVESLELAQANLKIIVEFAWDKLKNERLKKSTYGSNYRKRRGRQPIKGR